MKKSATPAAKKPVAKKNDANRPKSPLQTGKGTPDKKRKNLVSQMEGTTPSLSEFLAPYERDYIQEIIDKCAGNLVQASLLLDVARNTLKSKIKKHKIRLPKP